MKYFLHKHNYESNARHHGMIGLLLIFFFLLPSSLTFSQLNLDFKRIELNFPQVKLFVQVRCSTDARLDMKKTDFTLKENGMQIDSFVFHCPDPAQACCISIALIFDRSGSMEGKPIADAKVAGKTFVDKMRTQCDEAIVMSFATFSRVDVAMTKNKATLKAGIDGIGALGQTAIWDATIDGITELMREASHPCKAIVLLSDGEDNKSSQKLSDVITSAVSNGIRVFTIGLNVTPQHGALLDSLARMTGGKYYPTPTSEQLTAIYTEIANVLGKNFVECEITYNSRCKDGTLRTVDLTLNFCGSAITKTKQYIAPYDSLTFQRISIKLGDVLANGLDDIIVPLILETPIDDLFKPFTCNVLFDTSCISFIDIERAGYLLDRSPIIPTRITGGIHLNGTLPQYISGSGILAVLHFKVRDPDKDRICTIKLTDLHFDAGCLIAQTKNGTITVVARKPIIDCVLQMPQSLVWNETKKDYTPNPFDAEITLNNTGNREAINAQAQIFFNQDDFDLFSPSTDRQPASPKIIIPKNSATASWQLNAKPRSRGDSVMICIRVTFDNHLPVECCRKMWIPPPSIPILHCALSAPQIQNDKITHRYSPMPFPITADVQNTGGIPTDSVFVQIILPPPLKLAGSDIGKESKLLAPYKLVTNGFGQVKWLVQHSPSFTEKKYSVTVCTRTSNADSVCCAIPIIIPPIDSPILECTITAVDSLFYDEVKDEYNPNPFPFTVAVKNTGSLDADSVRATLVLPPEFVLEPPTQLVTKYFNPMLVVKYTPPLPPNEISWMVKALDQKKKKASEIKVKLNGVMK